MLTCNKQELCKNFNINHCMKYIHPFRERKCKYFPCHDLKDMDCTYCYCPRYEMKGCQDKMRGKRLKNGLKDCSKCIQVHDPLFVRLIKNDADKFKKKFKELLF